MQVSILQHSNLFSRLPNDTLSHIPNVICIECKPSSLSNAHQKFLSTLCYLIKYSTNNTITSDDHLNADKIDYKNKQNCEPLNMFMLINV